MPLKAVVTSTPYYVLMDGDRRIGPSVVQGNSGIPCFSIFGFSNKLVYDRFCANSQLTLKPYPLVIGYLRNQVAALGDDLKLVTVDATGTREPYLNAATMEDVLEAQENRTTCVTATHRLILDQAADAYRAEEASE
jgi:hypothetical protein